MADTGNNRIQKFTSEEKFFGQWTKYGDAEREVIYDPIRIAIDHEGNIFIASGSLVGEVLKFTPDGKFIAKWSTGSYTTIYDITIDSADKVYVAYNEWMHGYWEDSIDIYNSNGIFLETWNTWGMYDEDCLIPSGIEFDSAGNLYIADTKNECIQKFTPDGELIAKWGACGHEG